MSDTEKVKIGKYKYQIEFETIEQNVPTIVEVITDTFRQHLAGSLTQAPTIVFSVYEEDGYEDEELECEEEAECECECEIECKYKSKG